MPGGAVEDLQGENFGIEPHRPMRPCTNMTIVPSRAPSPSTALPADKKIPVTERGRRHQSRAPVGPLLKRAPADGPRASLPLARGAPCWSGIAQGRTMGLPGGFRLTTAGRTTNGRFLRDARATAETAIPGRNHLDRLAGAVVASTHASVGLRRVFPGQLPSGLPREDARAGGSGMQGGLAT